MVFFVVREVSRAADVFLDNLRVEELFFSFVPGMKSSMVSGITVFPHCAT